METDSTAPENTDQAVCNTDEQVPAQARSYECTFCKRGFSNAQALGGHMNMHRKDKAKLKHASNKLMDIPESTPLYSPIPINKIQTLQSKSTEEKSMTKRPWTFSPEGDAPSRDETHLGQLRQLPLFDETASNNENQKQSSHVGTNTGKGFLSVQESAGPELDLELRLGHEPQTHRQQQERIWRMFYFTGFLLLLFVTW